MDEGVMTKLGLTLNEAKTSVRDARRERFDFLGYTFGPAPLSEGRSLVSGGKPVAEERAAPQDAGGRDAGARQRGRWDEVRARLNRVLRGWSAYFCLWYALAWPIGRSITMSTRRSRHFLRGATRCRGAARDRFSRDDVFRETGVLRLRRMRSWPPPTACGEASRKAGCRKSARPV